MLVSEEVVAIVVSALGVVLALGASIFAGGAWIVRRIDSVEARLSARIDSVEEKLTARIDSVEEKLTARIDGLAADMTDVKVAIARLEGPPRHLFTAVR